MTAPEFLGEYSELYEVALYLERQRSAHAEQERWDGVAKPKTVEPRTLPEMCLEVVQRQIFRADNEAEFKTRWPPRFYWRGWGYLEHEEPEDEDEPRRRSGSV